MDQALAVDLQVAGPHAGKVRDWIESVLGWQPVDGSEGGLVPVLTLTDARATAVSVLPTIMLVDETDGAAVVASRVVQAQAAAVLVWPAERDQLSLTAARVVRHDTRTDLGEGLRVGGTAGGVGTTTVALALGGLAAWSGVTTLVLGRGPVPVRGVARIDASAVAAHGLWAHATVAPGLSRLRALAVDGPRDGTPLAVNGADLVVGDMGVDTEDDVLVGRRDAATLAALELTCASVLVLADDGPAPPNDVRQRLGRRRLVVLPRSNRVAAAGLSGRVPTALPGRWLASLRPIVGGLVHHD